MHFRSRPAGQGLRVCAIALALMLGPARPIPASAETAVWPLEAGAHVLIGFGETYAGADGQPATHRGADLAASPGDAVVAPCAGVVRFVGRVPSIGSSETQLVLTIESEEGVRFTLMPLGSTSAAVGECVVPGARVGEVAAQGDGSSAGTHLHVGARRGELYVDPLQFLTAPSTGSEAPDSDATAESASVGVATPSASPAHTTPAAGAARSAGSAAHEAPAAETEVAPRATTPVATGAPASAATRAAARQSAAATVDSPSTNAAYEASVASRPRVAPAPTIATAHSPFADLLASVVSRGVPSALGSLTRLMRAWFVAATALLAAAGALWPLWRRTPSVGEPGLRVAPVGGEIAAAAGR